MPDVDIALHSTVFGVCRCAFFKRLTEELDLFLYSFELFDCLGSSHDVVLLLVGKGRQAALTLWV
tara:strand:- start:410 stop:604 length:195 start_codon:yes stop_codon:yes gene_type:complete